MRRRVLALAALCSAVVLLGSIACSEADPAPAPPPPPPQITPDPDAQRVNVVITCDGEHTDDFRVRPHTAQLSKTMTNNKKKRVDFYLLGPSDNVSVEARPKAGETWPFTNPAPITFDKYNKGATGDILAGTAPGVYGYDFVVTCGNDEDVIDPKMDVRP